MIIQGIEIPVSLYNEYITDVVNKIFKMLPIYENCELKSGNFEEYESYLDKVITMLIGSEFLFEDRAFLSIASILKGMQIRDDLTHKKVKSSVFHCIDILGKLKQSEV